MVRHAMPDKCAAQAPQQRYLSLMSGGITLSRGPKWSAQERGHNLQRRHTSLLGGEHCLHVWHTCERGTGSGRGAVIQIWKPLSVQE